MDQPTGAGQVVHASSRARWHAVAASMVGTTVEWYDFAIYGAAASLVFGKIFFPGFNPTLGLLASYGSFAAGFVARPFGGVVFSYFGDKFGRKPVLAATILVMGFATMAIGCLPGYARIGIAAPILLVVLRLIQGFGAGGEFSGAILFASEYTPSHHRGFFGSFAPASVTLALVLASGVFAGFAYLPTSQFMAWGWRIPFLLSIVAVIIGFFIRRRVDETPEYKAVRETARKVRVPMIEVLRQHPKLVALAFGTIIAQVMGYLYIVFATAYITNHAGLSKSFTLATQMICFLIAGVVCVASGALSDRIGRRPILFTASIASAIYGVPLFWLLDTRKPGLVFLAMLFGVMVQYPMFGISAAFLTDLFPTKLRYSGITLARESAYALLGGPLPLVATAAVAAAGGNSWPVSIIMLVMGLTSAACIAMLPRGAGEAGFHADRRDTASDEPRVDLSMAAP
jgi:MHS family shikimate/dehydroshikimate transporter-like MFS transporter